MPMLNAFRFAVILLCTLVSITTLQARIAHDVASNQASSGAHYRIDSERSWLRVLVYRDGLLSGLGHNHVVSHNDISGTIVLLGEPLQADIAIELKVAEFVVDDAQLRIAEGDDFLRQVSHKDIAGTRSNMLGKKLLSADSFPTIRIQSTAGVETLPKIELEVIVTVLDREHHLVVPATVVLSENAFVATGELSISHSDIGLSPFNAVFGALQVRDRLDLKFEMHGTSGKHQ